MLALSFEIFKHSDQKMKKPANISFRKIKYTLKYYVVIIATSCCTCNMIFFLLNFESTSAIYLYLTN